MLSRTSPPATPPLPASTYLLASDGVIQDTELGFAWRDALGMLWDGTYASGAPNLFHMDLGAGTVADVTLPALIELADRAHVEGETPAHLRPLFARAGIAVPACPPRRAALPPQLRPANILAMSTALSRRRAIFGAHTAEG